LFNSLSAGLEVLGQIGVIDRGASMACLGVLARVLHSDVLMSCRHALHQRSVGCEPYISPARVIPLSL